MSKGGTRPNAGRKPIWDTDTIRTKVAEHTETWWTQIGKMMTSKNPGERKFALSEFNKLQVKAMPQQLTGEGNGPIQVTWLSPSPTPPEGGQKHSTQA